MSDGERSSEANSAGMISALSALVVLTSAGFGQLHPQVAQWMAAGADRALTSNAWFTTHAVTWPSPGFEFLSATLHALAPGDTLSVHYALSLLAASAIFGVIGKLGAELADGWLGGIASGLALLSMPPVVLICTSPGPAALSIAAAALVVLGLTRRAPGPLLQIVTLVAGAIWVLLWPPAIFLLAVAWCVRLWLADSSEHADSGDIKNPDLPIGIALAPVVLIALVTVYPAFWPDPIGRWGLFLYDIVSGNTQPVIYAGSVFREGRPYIFLGAQIAWESLPLPVVVLAAVGIIVELGRSGGSTRRRLVKRMLLGAVVAAALMPWLSRSRSVAGVPHLALLAVGLAPLAGSLLGRLANDIAEWFTSLSETARSRIALGVIGAALLPGAMNVVAAHPVSDCWWNSLVGGPQGAAQTGRPVCRQGGLPFELVDEDLDVYLYGGDAKHALTTFQRSNWLDDQTEVAPSAAGADAIVRRAETMVPGHSEVTDNPDALVAPARTRLRELTLDDLSVWRIDQLGVRGPQITSDDRNDSTSSSE